MCNCPYKRDAEFAAVAVAVAETVAVVVFVAVVSVAAETESSDYFDLACELLCSLCL